MMVETLMREEVKAGLEDGSILLIDVREPHEFAAGHIPGSLSFPLSMFDPAELPEAGLKKIVFSCAAGVRSLHAIMAAADADLAHNAHYGGGFRDWAMANEEIAY